MSDREIEGIATAYEALKGLDRQAWLRALIYLGKRLAEDDRHSFMLLRTEEMHPLVQWVLAGDLSTVAASPAEVVGEANTGNMELIEVNGIAVVSQRYAVYVAIEEGEEVEWFDDRATAEAFINERREP